jgi:hypothetical protein
MNCGHVQISCDEACLVASEPAGSCIAWRQTTECSGTGPRQPENDQGCGMVLEPGWSGFCECGQQVVQMDCGHSEVTCAQACGS